QAKGVRSIDVGCMQINLFYHGKAFPDLETAFDPASNVAYAIEFLTNLKTETGSWNAAAVSYHSKTPEYANRYRAKLREEWTDLASDGRPPRDTAAAETTTASATPRATTLSRELAQARAEQAAERAARLAETARQQAAAREFAEAWRAERLAAYRRAKNGES
ncbi:MAG: transglycosylase SLT domain-containing protein, partial [Rhodospirillaceae bacterium]